MYHGINHVILRYILTTFCLLNLYEEVLEFRKSLGSDLVLSFESKLLKRTFLVFKKEYLKITVKTIFIELLFGKFSHFLSSIF